MKPFILFIIIGNVYFFSCAVQNEQEIKEYTRIIPDNTPFISGIVEASQDTTHYYTQVVIGYVTDSKFVEQHQEIQHIPKIFSPTLWSQIVRTLQRFTLAFEFENDAIVKIAGPIGHELEKEVQLSNEGYGVYGDTHYGLNLVPGYQYELFVLLPNGLEYNANTFIPEQVKIVVPDSVGLLLTLTHYDDGVPHERSNNYEWIKFDYPKYNFITESQKNTSSDRELLNMEPQDRFLFEDRGEYLRTGINYSIWNTNNKSDSSRIIWSRTINQSWVKEKKVKYEWRRFAFFSEGMWRNHQTLNSEYSGIGDKWEQMNIEFIQAAHKRDSTFLFEVSTINQSDRNEQIRPNERKDAIGFFAGNFSVYKKLVVYPIRNYDIDSLYKSQGL